MSSVEDPVYWREFRILLDRVTKLEQELQDLRRDTERNREMTDLRIQNLWGRPIV